VLELSTYWQLFLWMSWHCGLQLLSFIVVTCSVGKVHAIAVLSRAVVVPDRCCTVCHHYVVLQMAGTRGAFTWWYWMSVIWSRAVWSGYQNCLCIWIWRSCDRASLMYSSKYNQQDATLYNILYCCQCSTCFGRFLRPSSGAQNCTHSIWYMSSLLAATASGSSKQAWQLHAVCTVLSSCWWTEKNHLKHIQHWQ
jgi:hypothetical protein